MTQTRSANTIPKPSSRNEYVSAIPSESLTGTSYSKRTQTRCVNGNCQEVVTTCNNGVCKDNQPDTNTNSFNSFDSNFEAPTYRKYSGRNLNDGSRTILNNGQSRNQEQHTECTNGVCKTVTKICNNGNCEIATQY